ncbi:uncharacterized protein LOC120780749 [Bactrocera tryoni]|uniref:uncharacterized protein LOC120780749 n=1 Tax=Bactrocera tryoni TaxID=59916 RepID=UPI001A96399E|nr:uncharacterized protein LOC120780749 [Bactrocera tryoni]
MSKYERGTSREYVASIYGVDVTSLSWKDNKIVNLVSTYIGMKPILMIGQNEDLPATSSSIKRDALQNMRISEDKEFLILQRQKGRPGSMAGVDMVLYRRQNRADHRIEKEMSRKRKHQQMSEVNLELEDDFGMDYEEDIGDSEPEVAETNVKKNTKQTASPCINRGRKHFITPRLLSALDSAKVSDGKAMHILMATAEALGHCTSDLVVNRSTLHRLREEHRRKETQRIQESFIDKLSDTQAMVVHWDGKVLPDLIGKIKVERIAVLVSYNGESKFLGAPKLISATDRVEGMSFDTTSTNTGPTS